MSSFDIPYRGVQLLGMAVVGAIAYGQIWMLIPNELCALLLLVIACESVRRYRMWGLGSSLKFIRAAYLWFAVAAYGVMEISGFIELAGLANSSRSPF